MTEKEVSAYKITAKKGKKENPGTWCHRIQAKTMFPQGHRGQYCQISSNNGVCGVHWTTTAI